MINGSYYYLYKDKKRRIATLHIQGCKCVETLDKKIFLGTMYTFNQAVSVAKFYSKNIRLCLICGDVMLNETNKQRDMTRKFLM